MGSSRADSRGLAASSAPSQAFRGPRSRLSPSLRSRSPLVSRGLPRSGSPALCPLPPLPLLRRQIRARPRVPAGGGAGGPQGRSLDVESKMGTAGGSSRPRLRPPKRGPKKSYRRQEAYTEIDSLRKEKRRSKLPLPTPGEISPSVRVFTCAHLSTAARFAPQGPGPRGGGTGWRGRDRRCSLFPAPANAHTCRPRDPGGSRRWERACECLPGARLCARGRVRERCAPPHTAVPGACSAHKDGSFAITAGNDPLEAEIKSWEK